MIDTPLAEACDVNPPRPKFAEVAEDTQVMFVPMAAVDEVTGTIVSPETRTLKELRSKSYRSFRPGDVIFAKITPCMENGKSAIVPEIPSGIGFGSTEFHVLRPKAGVDARYVWHFLRQESFRGRAEEAMTGSVGQARVPASFIESFRVPLPLEDTQRRVADLLDSALASGHSAVAHLENARNAIERFRRALIIAAVTGRLTAGWRVSRGRIDGGAIPSQWKVTTIAEIAECLDRQRRPVNAAARAARVGDVPYYGANGQVGWIDESLFNEELVLVVEDETFTGRTKPFSYVITGPAWVNNHAHVLRAREGLSTEMLNIALSYYDFVPLTSGTTGRRKLNQAALLSAPIVLAPPDEQAEIVRLVRQAQTLGDSVLERVASGARCVQRSSQAVLAKAFRGGLAS